jgi:MarR family transcriptional regulator, transcriptional regulator for hemolysin
MIARNSSSEQGLGFILNDISRLARKEFDRRVRPLRLTRAQWLVLVHLARQPGCTQSELADSLQLQKITVGRHAERLLRAGWIERRDDAKDARAYRLFVSRKAGPLLAKLTTVADELRREYLDGLTDARCEALVSDLLHIKSNLLRLEEKAR